MRMKAEWKEMQEEDLLGEIPNKRRVSRVGTSDQDIDETAGNCEKEGKSDGRG